MPGECWYARHIHGSTTPQLGFPITNACPLLALPGLQRIRRNVRNWVKRTTGELVASSQAMQETLQVVVADVLEACRREEARVAPCALA